ncbi:3705_t:CDS:2 [Funneliformis mosseae]|uniref:Histone H1 n=1 Tax=Funneliformis mosseae TaxID=27381 RepID=A0A9N9DTV9_FUNMO|nr:3705_t:CDS:2 [Funneliformis mosseae]
MDFNFAKFYHQQKLLNTKVTDEDIAKLYLSQQEAIVALNERKGSSRQAIKNYILTTYKLPDNNLTNKRLRLAVKKGVNNGLLFFPNGPSDTIKYVMIKKEK